MKRTCHVSKEVKPIKYNPFAFEEVDIADLFVSSDETYVYIIETENGWRRCTEFGELLGNMRA